MANIILIEKLDGTLCECDNYEGINISFTGDNSTVILGEKIRFTACKMIVASNVKIEIQTSKYRINKLNIWAANNSQIKIGIDFSCWGVEIRCQEAGSMVSIGTDCMFSEQIVIYPTDVHTIYDVDSKAILNKNRPISIGNHVWCGRAVSILKGSTIGDNIVIGMGTIVHRSFYDSNIVIGGYPVSILRKNTNWDRRNPYNFEKAMSSNL